METRVYTKEALVKGVRSQIYRNDDQAIKALLEIYSRQTAAEQEVETTRNQNGVGFTKNDAGFLTSLAKNYLKYKKLSPKQMQFLKTYIQKYARQLVDGSIEKGLIRKEGHGKYVIVHQPIIVDNQKNAQTELFS